MHTFKHDDAEFNYNPDLSGFVFAMNNSKAVPVSISGHALRAFMAHFLRKERIAEIENMTDDEILRGA